MSNDTVEVRDKIADLWDDTDIPQSQFAALLRDEADLYEELPGEASAKGRVILFDVVN